MESFEQIEFTSGCRGKIFVTSKNIINDVESILKLKCLFHKAETGKTLLSYLIILNKSGPWI